MPIAPGLPQDPTTQAAASGGMKPANFLIAAADMHNSGQLTAPSGDKTDLLSSAKSRKPFGKKIQIVK